MGLNVQTVQLFVLARTTVKMITLCTSLMCTKIIVVRIHRVGKCILLDDSLEYILKDFSLHLTLSICPYSVYMHIDILKRKKKGIIWIILLTW